MDANQMCLYPRKESVLKDSCATIQAQSTRRPMGYAKVNKPKVPPMYTSVNSCFSTLGCFGLP